MAACYRFGPFVVYEGSHRLIHGDEVVHLPSRAIDLLLYLVARPSMLVSKEELFSVLWPRLAVTENSLMQIVSKLRSALDDDPASPAYIQTVARRGYRFIASV